MNYNNYSNNNQIFYGVQKVPNSNYYQNPYEAYDTYSNHSTQSNFSNTNYNNINNINIINNKNKFSNNVQLLNKGKTLKPKNKNKVKKKVKFNEVVDVILVKSYKKYNKDDESSYNGNIREENPYKDNNNKSYKKANRCECNII